MNEAGATLLTRLGGVLLVLFVALIANRITKSVVVRGIARLARRTTLSWDVVVMQHRVLQRVAHLVPALVIYHFATPVLAGYDQLTAVVRQGALISAWLETIPFIVAFLSPGLLLVSSTQPPGSSLISGTDGVMNPALGAWRVHRK